MDKPHEEHKSENRHRHDSKPYTRIDNELLEAMARIRIPGEAMQVLLVIARKTYGYQKREDSIPLSQFNLYTGISKPSIVRAIETLESKMNIIYKKVNGHSAIYRINKDFSTWNPLPKRSTFTKKLTNVYKKVNNRLLKSNPQKKKEKKKKECSLEDSHSFPSSTGTPVREIISYFSHLALTEQGVNPVVDGADIKAV